MLEKEIPLFVLRSIQHTEIKSVGRMQNFNFQTGGTYSTHLDLHGQFLHVSCWGLEYTYGYAVVRDNYMYTAR
jgi:hypothetical protein